MFPKSIISLKVLEYLKISIEILQSTRFYNGGLERSSLERGMGGGVSRGGRSLLKLDPLANFKTES